MLFLIITSIALTYTGFKLFSTGEDEGLKALQKKIKILNDIQQSTPGFKVNPQEVKTSRGYRIKGMIRLRYSKFCSVGFDEKYFEKSAADYCDDQFFKIAELEELAAHPWLKDLTKTQLIEHLQKHSQYYWDTVDVKGVTFSSLKKHMRLEKLILEKELREKRDLGDVVETDRQTLDFLKQDVPSSTRFPKKKFFDGKLFQKKP